LAAVAVATMAAGPVGVRGTCAHSVSSRTDPIATAVAITCLPENLKGRTRFGIQIRDTDEGLGFGMRDRDEGFGIGMRDSGSGIKD
jgi:hypothetical protein